MIGLICIGILALICLAADIRNDIRLTRLEHSATLGGQLRRALSSDVKQLTANQNSTVRSVHSLVEVSKLHNLAFQDVQRKINKLEGAELRRMYAARLADGTFKTVKRPRAHKVTTQRRNGR